MMAPNEALGAVDDDVVARWNAQRAGNRRVTLIDLYAMVAGPRGLAPHELPREERRALTEQAMGIIVPGHATIPGSDTTDQPIEVVAADPAWRTRFEGYRAQLASVLGPVARRIEHVGSTSVPGLDAKPVIDVQISVRDLADEGVYVPAIERIGIEFRSRDDERRYFRPAPPRPRDVHVHVCAEGSAWERDHLLYRDYLRTHPDACKRYAATKWENAERWRDDRWAYTEAKTACILDLLERAEQWAAETGWVP